MKWAAYQFRERAGYFFILCLLPAMATFGHYLTPDFPILFGQDLGILLGVIFAAVAVFAWMFFREKQAFPPIAQFTLILILVAWTYQIMRMQFGQNAYTYAVFVVPLAVSMILLKPVTKPDLNRGLLGLAYSLVAIAVISFVFGKLGLVPNGFDVSDAGGPPRYAWLENIGIESRWGGPWMSVNRASAIGGLLLVIGAIQHRWHRVFLMVVGAALVMLGGSRAALMAAGLALLIILLTQGPINDYRHKLLIRISAIVGLVSVFVVYVTVFDPTLALRTPIWSYFLDLIPQTGLVGHGDSGVNEYVNALPRYEGFIAHTDPHNIYLDWLVRYGWLMLGLSLVILGVAGFLAMRVVARGNAAPMALIVYVVIYGVADSILSWIYWSAFLVVIVWSVLFSASSIEHRTESHDHEPADKDSQMPKM